MRSHTRPTRRVELEPGALRRAREERGLTILALSYECGVSYSHLAAVERGTEGISPPSLLAVATCLNVDIADLRRRDDG